MSKIALVPHFKVNEGQMDAFIARMRQHRDNCLKLEPGCRYFDITIDEARPNEVLLYEVYDDADAVTAHRQYPHFLSFKEDTEQMVADVKLATWTLVD